MVLDRLSGYEMNSRERIIAALKCQDVDYVPFVNSFNPLRESLRVGYRFQFPWGPSEREECEYCIDELGIDPVVNFTLSGNYPSDGVSSKVWLDGATIHKVWTTPAGELRSAVKYNEKWPHGLDIPFFSDFNCGHATVRWIESEQDIECLRHILRPIDGKDNLDKIRFKFMEKKRLADRLNIAVCLHAGKGLTSAVQMFGPNEICMATMEEPGLVEAYVELEHECTIRMIEIGIELGVDFVTRNGFYETADLFSPDILTKYLAGPLSEEIKAIHTGGLPATYVINTGVMPILDHLAGLDFDCLQSIDIAFNDTDLSVIKGSQKGKKSFMIGPSSTYHIWQDDPEITRDAVRECFDVIGKKGLLIKPCASVHSIMPWGNTVAMVDEWKKLRAE